MSIILDIVIAAGALLAAAYCLLLSRRLRNLTRLDGEVGKAIAMLSQQVDALTHALKAAENSTAQADTHLQDKITRAEAAARKLELLMAAKQPTHLEPEVSANAAHSVLQGGREPVDGFAPFGRARVATRQRHAGRHGASEVSS